MTTMAAALAPGTAAYESAATDARIVRVEILRDFAAAESAWRKLQTPADLSTPFQRFEFLRAWQAHVGIAAGIVPLIAIGYDRMGDPVVLLPLGERRERGLRIASFLGGKHSTFNMALWRRDLARRTSRADLDLLIRSLRAARPALDLVVLRQQPHRWNHFANPLALLPHQPSVNDCPLLTMTPGTTPASRVGSSMRRRLKGKERKLQPLVGYRSGPAADAADVARLLAAFFRIKPLRMAAQRLPNVFAEPGVADFIREACATALPGGGQAIEIHALQSDDEVLALFAGVADGRRFSMMFNTYTMSDHARHSPGLILMRDIIDHYFARGFTSLDLGVGSDDYKRLFCKSDEPIFDSFIALSPRGTAAAAMLSIAGRIKRRVKRSPLLTKAALLARRIRG